MYQEDGKIWKIVGNDDDLRQVCTGEGAALAAMMAGGSAGAAAAQQKPNIVLIYADDLGYGDLSCQGATKVQTPNIDKLASQGMIFTQAYAAPVCSPTRASIQSGQYPARVGIFDFITGHWRPYEEVRVPVHEVQHLPGHITTLGDALQAAGYATAYYGKWHLGFREEHLPHARGYSQAHTYAGGGFYTPRFIPEYHAQNPKRLSDILTDMGVDFIKAHRDEPFFLFVSHYDVHVQLDADRDVIDKYLNKGEHPDYACNAVYAAMIEHMDKRIGDVLDAVDENTLVVFASDNGGTKSARRLSANSRAIW